MSEGMPKSRFQIETEKHWVDKEDEARHDNAAFDEARSTTFEIKDAGIDVEDSNTTVHQFKSSGHTNEEWNGPELSWSNEKVAKKVHELGGYRQNRSPNDVIIGHGIGTEEFGYMKGTYGLFIFYRKPDGTEYYEFANPPS